MIPNPPPNLRWYFFELWIPIQLFFIFILLLFFPSFPFCSSLLFLLSTSPLFFSLTFSVHILIYVIWVKSVFFPFKIIVGESKLKKLIKLKGTKDISGNLLTRKPVILRIPPERSMLKKLGWLPIISSLILKILYCKNVTWIVNDGLCPLQRTGLKVKF